MKKRYESRIKDLEGDLEDVREVLIDFSNDNFDHSDIQIFAGTIFSTPVNARFAERSNVGLEII